MPVPHFVLDPTALEASFYENDLLEELLADADAGLVHLYLPAVAVAQVETELRAGVTGWGHLLFNLHVDTMPLEQSGALEIGQWSGSLGVRHTVLEARRLGGSVVTTQPGLYADLRVALRIV